MKREACSETATRAATVRQGLLDPSDIEAQVGLLVAEHSAAFDGGDTRYEPADDLPPALRY